MVINDDDDDDDNNDDVDDDDDYDHVDNDVVTVVIRSPLISAISMIVIHQ